MAAAGTPKDDTGLERKMESRHLTMISLGGVIGTGLFVSSGYTIHQAGPLGAILAYAVGSLLVYCVMVSLGELSVAMPYAGSFHMYAKRFIGPGTAFTIAILYWLNWAVALASEFTAAGLLMQRWFPHSPSWVWSAVFIVVVFALNIMSVRLYGEAEFWFASIKVFAIIAFIVIGLLAIFGAIPIAGHDSAPLLGNFVAGGWFPSGIAPIFSTLLTVVFAFSGTEVVAWRPAKPRILACDSQGRAHHGAAPGDFLHRLDSGDGGLDPLASGRRGYEPVRAGVPVNRYAVRRRHHELRGVDGRASAANSGLYVCSRMVWSLAKERLIPERFARTNFRGVPVWAVLFSMAGSLLALLSSVIAASTVYLVLVAVSGLATLVVWFSVCVCHIRFRREWARDGHSADELGYRAPGFPVLPWLAIVMCIGALVLVVLDDTQRSTCIA